MHIPQRQDTKVLTRLHFTLKYGGLPPIARCLDVLLSEAPIFPLNKRNTNNI